MLGLVLLILILLFTVPIIFKDKIKTKVEKVINESVNANVKFADYKLGFFRNFPNLSFGMKIYRLSASINLKVIHLPDLNHLTWYLIWQACLEVWI